MPSGGHGPGIGGGVLGGLNLATSEPGIHCRVHNLRKEMNSTGYHLNWVYFALRGYLHSLETFLVVTTGVVVLLASSGWRPGMC